MCVPHKTIMPVLQELTWSTVTVPLYSRHLLSAATPNAFILQDTAVWDVADSCKYKSTCDGVERL